MKKIKKTFEFGGKELTLETGHVAMQATGAVMASVGETVVLATVVASELKEDRGYFPLSVEYQERLSAGGRIKGSRWVKRAGRPTDDEILTARLIDRSIRPLFPKDYNKDVQVIVSVLSVDMENSPDMIACAAVSAAIAASPIPWEGPVGMTRVGLVEDKYFTNPIDKDLERSEMDLVVSTVKDAVVMIEAGANEVPEDKVLKGIEYGYEEGKKLVKFIEEFAKEVGIEKEKIAKEKPDTSIQKKVKELSKGKMDDLIRGLADKTLGYSDLDEVKEAIADNYENDEDRKKAKKYFEELLETKIKDMILSGKRPDGRKEDQIRDLSAQVGVLPRTHGSAIFQRGNTQALTVATLGSPSLEQLIETAEGEESKRYIHHYSMPPYSVGETGRVGYPGRREIGHGALAERALLPVIPSEKDFPYTIYVLTEILSSNGSTSMASTCGSTLALMDAGVPIKASVAGIAMGLVVESEENFKVLTDIVGLEDGNGDMDFKVAGTKQGITALQLDVKTLKLKVSILKTAFEQARKARVEILEVMDKAIKSPRKEVSSYAPKIKNITIDKEKIGEVIGPGGKTIRKLMAETNTQIDVDDDGVVSVTGIDSEEVEKAVSMIEGLTKDPVPGEIYEGEVKRIQNFGAFVEILPGKEGLVHISDMSEEYVNDPKDVVSEGDKVKVRVKEIDKLGRLNLSMILDPEKDKKKARNNKGDKKRSSSSRNSGRRSGNNKGNRSSGPHFPTSRLVDDSNKR
jgi:polyribonucleotide nucleotidyltransferase